MGRLKMEGLVLSASREQLVRAGFQVCGLDDLLRAHAGGGHGQRSHYGLLAVREVAADYACFSALTLFEAPLRPLRL